MQKMLLEKGGFEQQWETGVYLDDSVNRGGEVKLLPSGAAE